MHRFGPRWPSRQMALAASLALTGCLGTDCFGSGTATLDVTVEGLPNDPSVKLKVFIEEGAGGPSDGGIGRQNVVSTHIGGTVSFKNLAAGGYGLGVVTEPPSNCTTTYTIVILEEGEQRSRTLDDVVCEAGELELVVSGLPVEHPMEATVTLRLPTQTGTAYTTGNGRLVIPLRPERWHAIPTPVDEPGFVPFSTPPQVVVVPLFARATLQLPYSPTVPAGSVFGIRPDPVALEVGSLIQLEAAAGTEHIPDATWSVADPAILGVTQGSPTWLARAAGLGPGTTTITASAHGLSATVTVVVTAVPLPNQPPAATITAPADGATFTEGASITFQGIGTDPEDGPIPAAALQWTSTLDGPLGTGPAVTRVLSEGPHTITLRATDSDGATGTASIGVQVDPPPPLFTVSVNPNPVDALAFGFGTTTVTIARNGGFAGPVTLSAGSLTKGIAATFNPATVVGTTATAAFDVAGFVAPGTYREFIGATGGTLFRSVPVDIRVTTYTPPDGTAFLLSVETPVSANRGGPPTAARVVLAREADFAGAVALSMSGLPAGVTATIAENPMTGSRTTVAFAAAASATPGTYSIDVTAQVPGVTRTATVQLIVPGAAAP